MSDAQDMSQQTMARGKPTAEAGRRNESKRIAMNATKPFRVVHVNSRPNCVPQLNK
jgi:hypothetical protein